MDIDCGVHFVSYKFACQLSDYGSVWDSKQSKLILSEYLQYIVRLKYGAGQRILDIVYPDGSSNYEYVDYNGFDFYTLGKDGNVVRFVYGHD